MLAIEQQADLEDSHRRNAILTAGLCVSCLFSLGLGSLVLYQTISRPNATTAAGVRHGATSAPDSQVQSHIVNHADVAWTVPGNASEPDQQCVCWVQRTEPGDEEEAGSTREL